MSPKCATNFPNILAKWRGSTVFQIGTAVHGCLHSSLSSRDAAKIVFSEGEKKVQLVSCELFADKLQLRAN